MDGWRPSPTGSSVDDRNRAVARSAARAGGRAPLDSPLRNAPRAAASEGVNALALTAADMPHPIDVVTIAVSFISLRLIFPALRPLVSPAADIVALVNPPFEAGRDE